MSTMHNPPHPGRILKSTVLGEEGGLSVQALCRPPQDDAHCGFARGERQGGH